MQKCPICDDEVWREEVDVGVGIIYGPYGCPCGWSEDTYYNMSNGESIAEQEHPNHVIDQWGMMYPWKRGRKA